mgnify:CR=1 FL=1
MAEVDPIFAMMPEDDGFVFAVVDGALVDDLPQLLHGGGLVGRPLYVHLASRRANAAGPWLVPCADDDAIDWLRGVMPREAMVWWLWPGDTIDAASDAIYHHLRGLGMVEVPMARPGRTERTGPLVEKVLFRHADPHVLIDLLPVLDARQRARFWGAARAVVLDATRRGGLRRARAPKEAVLPAPGMLRLAPEQFAALEDRRAEASHARIGAWLSRHLPPQLATMQQDELAGIAAQSEPSGREMGLASEAALGRWTYLMLVTGGHVAEMADVTGAIRDAADAEAAVKAVMQATVADLRAKAGL